jgi:hypothetical protein
MRIWMYEYDHGNGKEREKLEDEDALRSFTSSLQKEGDDNHKKDNKRVQQQNNRG